MERERVQKRREDLERIERAVAQRRAIEAVPLVSPMTREEVTAFREERADPEPAATDVLIGRADPEPAIQSHGQTAEPTPTAGHPAVSKVCVCGNVFADDSTFCRMCGRPRPGTSEVAPASLKTKQEMAASRTVGHMVDGKMVWNS